MLTQYNESLPQTGLSLCCGNIPLLEGNFEDVGLGLDTNCPIRPGI